jgi:hypothetical protein
MAIASRPRDELAAALDATSPVWALRRAAIVALEGGMPRDVLLERLEALRAEARRHDDDAEDAVLDVMDFVSGWATPKWRL